MCPNHGAATNGMRNIGDSSSTISTIRFRSRGNLTGTNIPERLKGKDWLWVTDGARVGRTRIFELTGLTQARSDES